MDAFTFGRWLKMRRRALDYTQYELARRAYCAEITIRKIEADALRPSRELAESLARALEIEPIEASQLARMARQRD